MALAAFSKKPRYLPNVLLDPSLSHQWISFTSLLVRGDTGPRYKGCTRIFSHKTVVPDLGYMAG